MPLWREEHFVAENPLFEAWLDTLDEGWWDDAGDAGGILDSLQEAFTAGYEKGKESNAGK